MNRLSCSEQVDFCQKKKKQCAIFVMMPLMKGMKAKIWYMKLGTTLPRLPMLRWHGKRLVGTFEIVKFGVQSKFLITENCYKMHQLSNKLDQVKHHLFGAFKNGQPQLPSRLVSSQYFRPPSLERADPIENGLSSMEFTWTECPH